MYYILHFFYFAQMFISTAEDYPFEHIESSTKDTILTKIDEIDQNTEFLQNFSVNFVFVRSQYANINIIDKQIGDALIREIIFKHLSKIIINIANNKIFNEWLNLDYFHKSQNHIYYCIFMRFLNFICNAIGELHNDAFDVKKNFLNVCNLTIGVDENITKTKATQNLGNFLFFLKNLCMSLKFKLNNEENNQLNIFNHVKIFCANLSIYFNVYRNFQMDENKYLGLDSVNSNTFDNNGKNLKILTRSNLFLIQLISKNQNRLENAVKLYNQNNLLLKIILQNLIKNFVLITKKYTLLDNSQQHNLFMKDFDCIDKCDCLSTKEEDHNQNNMNNEDQTQYRKFLIDCKNIVISEIKFLKFTYANINILLKKINKKNCRLNPIFMLKNFILLNLHHNLIKTCFKYVQIETMEYHYEMKSASIKMQKKLR